jgi:DnaJ-class molecular chaperone
MGYDVHGLNPNARVGRYFGRNMCGWPPLWDYCCSVSELARQVKHGYSNDGDGLDARRAKSLAKALQTELGNGRTNQYVAQREKTLMKLPDEPCSICSGKGQQPEPIGTETIQCYHCEGTGKVRPSDTHYHCDERDVREFAEFLKHCGGFAID